MRVSQQRQMAMDPICGGIQGIGRAKDEGDERKSECDSLKKRLGGDMQADSVMLQARKLGEAEVWRGSPL